MALTVQADVLTDAQQVFAPKNPEPSKAKPDHFNKSKDAAVKAWAKKEATRKTAA